MKRSWWVCGVMLLIFGVAILVFPWRSEGRGCILFDEEYRLLIIGKQMVWIDNVPESIPEGWGGYGVWHRMNYSGRRRLFGVFGMLGKFRSEISLDSVWNGAIDESCKDTIELIWRPK